MTSFLEHNWIRKTIQQELEKSLPNIERFLGEKDVLNCWLDSFPVQSLPARAQIIKVF
jgi:isoleucyl-tRNA synthetase